MTIRQFQQPQKLNLTKPSISAYIGGGNVTIDKLEQQVAELRSRPLMVLCKTPDGKEKVMCLEERHRTGSRYIHVAANDLDQLLSAALEDRHIPKSGENARKCQHKKGC